MPETLPLPDPIAYFPPANGRYEVTAGLRKLQDAHFQVDSQYLAYMAAKARARRETPGGVYLIHALPSGLAEAIARFVLEILPMALPGAFQTTWTDGGAHLSNHLLGLDAELDLAAGCVRRCRRTTAALAGGEALFADETFEGVAVLDYLALQTQEDWAVTAVEPGSRRDWLAALHVSFPNHWRPADKIGQSFVEVHAPVAGIAPLIQAAPAMIEAMVSKGPWERFIWDVRGDAELDRHPWRAVPDIGPPDSMVLRSERQVLQGFPAEDGALFLIRTYMRPLAEVAADPARRRALAAAVASMTPASLAYKGLAGLEGPLLRYLDDFSHGSRNA